MKSYTVYFASSHDFDKTEIMGTGFVLTNDGLIATCSHVIQNKESQRAGEQKPKSVKLSFVASDIDGYAEVVDEWWRPIGQGDIAILKLTIPESLPNGVRPALLSRFSGSQQHDFQALGYPRGRERWATGKIIGEVTDPEFKGIRIIQLRSEEDTIAPGHSGAAVLDLKTQYVVGMVAALDAPDSEGRGANNVIAINLDELIRICPKLDKVLQPNDEVTKSWSQDEGFRPPIDPDNIFGRQQELEKIDELLTQHSALAIAGVRGTGKSTLASMYVDRIQEKGKYAGVYWRKFDETIDIGDVVGSFLEFTGKPIANIGSYKLDQQLSIFFREIEKEGSPYFLVFDNFEALIDPETSAPLKAGFSELIERANQIKGESRLLFTCWECPASERGIKPECYQIGGLDSQAALKLLQKMGLDEAKGELMQAIEGSEGHPQALTLLIQLVKGGQETISQALADASLWKGEVAERILDKVYLKRLSDDERKFLQFVSLFREPVPLSSILAVANNPVWTEVFAKKLAFNLNMKSLLNKADENYWEESLIRSYAYSRMADRVFRHNLACNYYLSLPLLEKPMKKEDVQPLIEAHYHACKAKEYDTAAKIIISKNLDEYLDLWGNYRTLLELCLLLLPKDDPLEGKPLLNEMSDQIRILMDLGHSFDKLGDYGKAIDYYTKARRNRKTNKRQTK